MISSIPFFVVSGTIFAISHSNLKPMDDRAFGTVVTYQKYIAKTIITTKISTLRF